MRGLLTARYLIESQKVSYFTVERGVPLDCLPMRRYESHVSGKSTDRYFVDKSDTPRGAGGLMSWAVSKTAGPWV